MAEKKKVTLKYSEPSNYFPKELRKMFEKMSRECANAMNGTHPPNGKKKTSKKKSVKGSKKKK